MFCGEQIIFGLGFGETSFPASYDPEVWASWTEPNAKMKISDTSRSWWNRMEYTTT